MALRCTSIFSLRGSCLRQNSLVFRIASRDLSVSKMASVKDTSTFFTEGTASQFKYVLTLYPQALRLKAENKTKKPEELIKLDNWYQNELPKKIKARGKDAHLNHEELCQLMKWKQTRGKAYPQLNYLVKVNTPRAVMAETKKAFKKLPNLELAITALSNLKGVGTTMASALLAAAAPESAPFMADECLLAIPDIEGIDYTTKEYLKFVNHIQQTAERLNKESPNGGWNAHQVELAVWTHFVASELRPELLDTIPETNGNSSHQNGESPAGTNHVSEEGDNSRSNADGGEDDSSGAKESRGDGETSAPIGSEEENSRPTADSQEDSVASTDSQRVEEGADSADSVDPAVGGTDDDSCAEPPPSKKARAEED